VDARKAAGRRAGTRGRQVAALPAEPRQRPRRHRPLHPGGHMKRVVLPFTVLAALAFTSSAFAHAIVSPSVVQAKRSEVFTLAVPTEKENATTTKIEFTPPAGFSIDSFIPTPDWKRDVQQTGSGENATVTKVTWTGAHIPTDEDAAFSF